METLENEPYSRRILLTAGGALTMELLFISGLAVHRGLTGDTIFLFTNLAAVVGWCIPYAVLVGPIAWIPMRDRRATIYSSIGTVLVVGITLPHAYFLYLPKTPANAQAGIGLFLTLLGGGALYLLLWLLLGVDAFLSD